MNTAEDSSHFGEMSSAAFLVYIAAVLFYKPIFTQPLGFVLCAAGAVEKFATDGTVSVVYLRDSISISKINAAFLTGQQIDRIHVQQLLLPSFMCQGAQHLLLYHELVCSATLRNAQILNISAHRKGVKSGPVVTN